MKRQKKISQKKSKILALLLLSILVLSLVACGKGNEEEQTVSETNNHASEYVYVPEYITMGDEENNNSFWNLIMEGNNLYYTMGFYDEATGVHSTKLYSYSLEDAATKEISLPLKETRNLNSCMIDSSENVFTIENDYSKEQLDSNGYPMSFTYLCKYDNQGNLVMEQDLAELLSQDENNSYISQIDIDKEGNIYLSSATKIFLFNSEGVSQGNVSIDNGWINGIGRNKEGKMYVTYYDYNSNSNGAVIAEIDFTAKSMNVVGENFPSSNGNGSLQKGVKKDFLVNDGNKLYEYDLETQTTEELFDWLDCDINGTYVEYTGVTEDGKIIAVIRDWDTNKTEIAKLTETKRSEVAQKQEIVIGVLSYDQALQASAVNFNKQSDTYHVTVKTYIDQNNWTETSWEDGITNLNNDIISGTNCPDILDLSNLNIKELASKGVFEDITPYLEESSVLKKEDFLENIVDSFTFDGVLVGIPQSFSLNTVVGRVSDVGEEKGWTLQDIIALAEANPDAQLFDNYSKSSMLYTLLEYNKDAYINWETGECKFDTEEFKQLLQFISTLPDEIDWESDTRSTPVKIQAGDVLLNTAYLYDFESIQEYIGMYGDDPITCIGYPTSDGSYGCYFNASSVYAIASKSDQKDGAWEFIESVLAQEGDSMFSWGFPSKKQDMEVQIEELTKVEYVLDENGEPMLDENGEPILASGTHSIGYGDWEYTYHTPTEEEIALIKELIEIAEPVFSGDNEWVTIITEEAQPFFQGQKSVDDVAGIIQSRIQLYVNEKQ